MIRSETTKRVRYAETDQMGHLYHGNYAYLYEIGRTEMMRDWGITYRDMEAVHGVLMPGAFHGRQLVRRP
jgi:acyl-CoA thioester hydrolase